MYPLTRMIVQSYHTTERRAMFLLCETFLASTSGLLNKADSAAFFRCPVADQLQGQVHCLHRREDFAIVVPTVLAIEHEEARGKIANFRHEHRLLTLSVIVDL